MVPRVGIEIVWSVFSYGLIMSGAFTALVVLQAVLGANNSVRDSSGRLALSAASPAAIVVFVGAFVLLIGAPVVANWHLGTTAAVSDTVLRYFWVGYGMVLVVNLWDLVVIDYFILLKLKPVWSRWIAVPQTEYYTTFRPHLIGFVRGLVIGVVSSAFSALVTSMFRF